MGERDHNCTHNKIKADLKHTSPQHVYIVQTFDRQGKLHRTVEISSQVRVDENKIGGKEGNSSVIHVIGKTKCGRAFAIKTVNVSGVPLLYLYVFYGSIPQPWLCWSYCIYILYILYYYYSTKILSWSIIWCVLFVYHRHHHRTFNII